MKLRRFYCLWKSTINCRIKTQTDHSSFWNNNISTNTWIFLHNTQHAHVNRSVQHKSTDTGSHDKEMWEMPMLWYDNLTTNFCIAFTVNFVKWDLIFSIFNMTGIYSETWSIWALNTHPQARRSAARCLKGEEKLRKWSRAAEITSQLSILLDQT